MVLGPGDLDSETAARRQAALESAIAYVDAGIAREHGVPGQTGINLLLEGGIPHYLTTTYDANGQDISVSREWVVSALVERFLVEGGWKYVTAYRQRNMHTLSPESEWMLYLSSELPLSTRCRREFSYDEGKVVPYFDKIHGFGSKLSERR